MRLLAVILGAIGIVVAAGNVWAFFIEWLSLLGILVPPIGAIILVDQFAVRRGAVAVSDWRGTAFAAWAAGSIVAFIVEKTMPYLRPRFPPPSRPPLRTGSCAVTAGQKQAAPAAE